MEHKFTTGAPHFIETGHMEPAPISQEQLEQVKKVVFHALDSLEITYGASHTELKIAKDGTIALIEIGGRMGGDFIGSNLVQLSTGIDFVKAVIDISLGEEPDLELGDHAAAGVRFVFDQKDVDILEKLKKEHPEYIVDMDIKPVDGHEVIDSSTRYGYCLMSAKDLKSLYPYLPDDMEE